MNNILLTDAYKASHHRMYPSGTKKVYSYLEARKSSGFSDKTIFFGLQYLLVEYLRSGINKHYVDEAETFYREVFGRSDVFDRSLFDYIVDHHDGRLPVEIKAVPEGTPVDCGNVLMTVENTDPKCFWLTSFLESLLLQVWYPSTVATYSWKIKKNMEKYYPKNVNLDDRLSDFGFRGASSVETAGIGGMAHLISFNASDNLAAKIFAKKYYGYNAHSISVPATEHSVCSILGKTGESSIYKRVLEEYPNGVVACVSDSFDIMNACNNIWGEELKDRVVAREGCLVVRPDSGDPVITVVKVLQALHRKFGGKINSDECVILPPYIRVIQGDGVDCQSIENIMLEVLRQGFSLENLYFGMGGALLQKRNRDEFGFSFKCSHAVIGGEAADVSKSPMEFTRNHDYVRSGKSSKSGRLTLHKDESMYFTQSNNPHRQDLLVTVFRNGLITKEYSLDEVRHNASR